MYSLILITFLLGTIIGSFLNVVALRFNTGKSLNGRSQCFSCGRHLGVLDLVPVLSYVALGGKCRKCKSAISAQYPIVEFITGVLFAAGFYMHLPLLEVSIQYFTYSLVLFWIVIGILMVISIYDIKHKIIPDVLSYAFAAVAFIYLVYTSGFEYLTTFPGVLDFLIAPLIWFVFWALWKVSHETWIGLGDAKLVIGIGWMLGFVNGISAVVLAFWVGALFSIILIIVSKMRTKSHIGMKTEIPFAPFLIIGFLLSFFFGWDVLHLKELFTLLI